MEGSGWQGSYYSTDRAYRGTRSLKLTGTTSTLEVTVATTDAIPLDPSHIYYASVYGFQDKKTDATVGFYWPIAEPSFKEGIAIRGSGSWRRYSARTSQSSFPAGNYQFRLDFNNNGIDGTMYFDGAMLIDLTACYGAGKEPTKAECESIPYFDDYYMAPTPDAPTDGLHLIKDRTQGDVNRASYLAGLWRGGSWTGTTAELAEWSSDLKGAYNASDLNRVGAAMLYVANRYEIFGYSIEVSPKTDWREEDIPSKSQLKHYLADLAALRELVAVLPTTPAVLEDMEGLTYTEANNIEKLLEDLDMLLTNIMVSWYYSGELYAGEC